MGPHINADRFAAALRERSVDLVRRRIRLAILSRSPQEADISEPVNCGGLGRVHHFRSNAFRDWPKDPLPMSPARKRLGLEPSLTEDMTAQVYQLASCNYRCWYCFVPYGLLHPTETNSVLISTDELVRAYQTLSEPPLIIDCSGGQPDLVPEWIPWMMRSLRDAGLEDTTFLWSDDNLSNDYYWQHLSTDDRAFIRKYRNYARVACFKGFDQESFSFNTGADPSLFERQFHLFERHLQEGVDQYAYVTLTGKEDRSIAHAIDLFVDRLQSIDLNLPLRTVPLRIANFGVVQERCTTAELERAMHVQQEAVSEWQGQLARRFSNTLLSADICDVTLGGH